MMNWTDPLLTLVVVFDAAVLIFLFAVVTNIKIEFSPRVRIWKSKQNSNSTPEKPVSVCPECGATNGAHLPSCSLSGCAAKPKAASKPRNHKCKICGQVGHDHRTCPNKTKEENPNELGEKIR